MSQELMNTKEVAAYLGIHEKQVYALIKAKRLPCTRVTGKWIFPKRLIDEWIESDARRVLAGAKERGSKIEGPLLVCGSNDPILDMLQTYMKKTYPQFSIFSANTGSTDGLKALNKGYTDIAWSHLYDPKSNEYNVPFFTTLIPDIKPVVVTLFYRELGLVVAPKNPRGIRGLEDLAKKRVRFVNRQKGSGTRLLLDYHLRRLKISPSRIEGYDKEVNTHLEVGLAVVSGEADTGIATVAISRLLGLPFIPIAKERFDMVLERHTFFERGVQALIEVLNSPDFRKRAEAIMNYDFRDSGKIIYP